MSQQIDGPPTIRNRRKAACRMPHAQPTTQAVTALLRSAASIDAQKTKILCRAAAGITALACSTIAARIPHKKLRRDASSGATLNAQNGPPAQLAQGCKRPSTIKGYQSLQQGQETYRWNYKAKFWPTKNS